MKMRKAALHNLGCKVNSYETEAMQQLLEAAGYEIVDFEDQADVYIINTCSVTNMADKKSRQMLHRAKAKNPDAVVVAAGCYVQAAGEKLKEDDAIDLVIGNNKKADLIPLLEEFLAGKEVTGSIIDEKNRTITHYCDYIQIAIIINIPGCTSVKKCYCLIKSGFRICPIA